MHLDTENLTKTFTITLTQSCNLNCSYCYENHKSKQYLSIKKAYEIIDKEISSCEKERKIEIDLFGGEPFIKFEHIKNIVEYVEANYSSRNITVFISTNGTLLTEEITPSNL